MRTAVTEIVVLARIPDALALGLRVGGRQRADPCKRGRSDCEANEGRLTSTQHIHQHHQVVNNSLAASLAPETGIGKRSETAAPASALEAGSCLKTPRTRPEFPLPASDCADDEKRLGPGRDCPGKDRIRRLVRAILTTAAEADEGPALQRPMVAERAAQDGRALLERVEDRALRDRTYDLESYLAPDFCMPLQMRRQNHADHDSVCTSTERTAGRSRTIGAQLSPP